MNHLPLEQHEQGCLTSQCTDRIGPESILELSKQMGWPEFTREISSLCVLLSFTVRNERKKKFISRDYLPRNPIVHLEITVP